MSQAVGRAREKTLRLAGTWRVLRSKRSQDGWKKVGGGKKGELRLRRFRETDFPGPWNQARVRKWNFILSVMGGHWGAFGEGRHVI